MFLKQRLVVNTDLLQASFQEVLFNKEGLNKSDLSYQRKVVIQTGLVLVNLIVGL